MRRRSSIVALVTAIGLALVGTLRATQILFTDFEGFNTGASIDRQNGWSSAPQWDEEVKNASGNTVWRVSNAVTSGSFSDMPFAPRLGGIPANTITNPTNDSPGAFAGESSTGASLDRFRSTFSFRSATGAPQFDPVTCANPDPDLCLRARITISADNGNGGRQTFIVLEDRGTGINVATFDVADNGDFIGAAGCNLDVAGCTPIVIASRLSYRVWHTTSVEAHFRDGASNDRVKYFVDGKLVHTGPSWEQYYRNVQFAQHPKGVPVQTLLFRLSGTPAPMVMGGGFYIDNVSQSVSRFGDGDDRDLDEDDSDHDGVKDDKDLDDDNDGLSDAVDNDDDDDGIEDAFDSKLTAEEQSTEVVSLASGEEARYGLAAGPNTVTLNAVLGDGQLLVLDILNPLGAVIATSLPAAGRAVVTVPAAVAGVYTLRVRNIGPTEVTSTMTLIRSDRR
jgi:hypothetical protein